MTNFEERCIKQDIKSEKDFHKYWNAHCDETKDVWNAEKIIIPYTEHDTAEEKYVSRKRRKQQKMRRQYKNSL